MTAEHLVKATIDLLEPGQHILAQFLIHAAGQ